MLDPNLTVAHVVLDHSETAPVFQRNRIDYCCRGNVSIDTACQQAGLDTSALIAELTNAIVQRNGQRGPDPRELSTTGLIAHIVATHHEYLRKTLPFVRALSQKVSGVHGDHNTRLRDLEKVVGEIVEALGPHLDAEEQTLFPALMVKNPDAAVVSRELASMHEDHLAVGSMLERMRDASEDFTVPDWGCTSYRTLFAELEQLERDILTHVHLENHVLMPRFIQA